MEKEAYDSKILYASKQKSVLKRFFFEKLGIKPNYNSNHELPKLFNLLEYAFANCLSAEEASMEMSIEVPDALVASADTLLRRLKESDKNSVEKAFNNTVKRFMKSMEKQEYIIAIDYHDIPYYGNHENDNWIRGTKNQRGTNYCHQYATLEIVNGEKRFTLAVRKLSVNDDEKSIIIKELITLARKHVQISLILLDRGFYNVECVRVLKELRFPFIMPVVKDSLMKKVMNEHRTEVPCIIHYTIGGKNGETFNLALKWLEKKNELPEIHGFATNMNASVEEIARFYSKRWSIETGYRSKKKFRIKTTTTNNLVRMIYFYMECLFYNAWYTIRGETKITIESFKKILEIIALKEIKEQSAVT